MRFFFFFGLHLDFAMESKKVKISAFIYFIEKCFFCLPNTHRGESRFPFEGSPATSTQTPETDLH